MPEALLALPAIAGGALDLAPGAVSIVTIGGVTQFVGVSTLLTGLGGTLLQVGLAVGAAEVVNLLTPRPQLQTQQQTVNDSLVPRRRGVGRGKIAGVRILWENTAGGRLAGLYFCEGPITSVEFVYYNDQQAVFQSSTPDANGVLTLSSAGPIGPAGQIEIKTGTQTQTSSYLARTFATEWTSDYLLTGCCYAVDRFGQIKQKDFLSVYKAGEPTVRMQMQYDAVWDPRISAQNPNENPYAPTTWTWSENAALNFLHYLRHPQGYNQPLALIDVASFIAMADLCDQAVPVKAGGSEMRYRAWGTWDLSEEPKAIQARFCAAMDADLVVDNQGRLSLRGGAWGPPTVTFSTQAIGDQPATILSFDMQEGNGIMLEFTRLQQSYLSPAHDFKMTPGDPWVDEAAEAAYGALPPATLPLDMVPSHGQSRRLAKIAYALKNPAWKGRIVTNFFGLQAIGERFIHLVIPELAIDMAFKVMKADHSNALEQSTFEVVSVTSAMYAWDYLSEEGTAPIVPPTDSNSGEVVATPTITSITQNSVVSGGAYAVTLTVDVATPTYTSYTLDIQYRVLGAANWLQASANQGVWTCDTGVLLDGQTYEVQAAFQSTTTVQSAWTASTDITVVADPTAPGPPSTFTATNTASGAALLTAKAPNSSNFQRLEFLRGTTTVEAAATTVETIYGAPSATLSISDASGDGTFYYWVLARNASNVASSIIGPVSVTVTG